MCDCIKLIREDLIKKTGDDDLDISTALMYQHSTGKTCVKAGKLSVWFRRKNKNGTFRTKQIKTFVSFSHCPFCGKEYEFIDERS